MEEGSKVSYNSTNYPSTTSNYPSTTYPSTTILSTTYQLPLYHLPTTPLPPTNYPSTTYHLPLYHLPLYHLPLYHLLHPPPQLLTVSASPLVAARSSGVRPWLSAVSRLTPLSTSSWTMLFWPFRHAQPSPVRPPWSTEQTEAPGNTIKNTHSDVGHTHYSTLPLLAPPSGLSCCTLPLNKHTSEIASSTSRTLLSTTIPSRLNYCILSIASSSVHIPLSKHTYIINTPG